MNEEQCVMMVSRQREREQEKVEPEIKVIMKAVPTQAPLETLKA